MESYGGVSSRSGSSSHGLFTKASEYKNEADISMFINGEKNSIYRTLKRSIQALYKDDEISMVDKHLFVTELIPIKVRRQMIMMVMDDAGMALWEDFFSSPSPKSRQHNKKERVKGLLGQAIFGMEARGGSRFMEMVSNLCSLLQMICDERDVKAVVMKHLLIAMTRTSIFPEERRLLNQLVNVPFDVLREFVKGDTGGPLEISLKKPKKTYDARESFTSEQDDVWLLKLGRQWQTE